MNPSEHNFTILLLFSLSILSVKSQPSPPPPDGYPYARFSPSMAIIIVVLVAALFFMGFFSIYIRRCSNDGGASVRAALSMRRARLTAATLMTWQLVDSWVLRRLAQNREAARKSRLRKKAYVQQLEASRLKLHHLEQQLEQTRAECALMSGRVNASHLGFPGAAKSGIAAFEIEYEQWVEEQNKKTNALKTALHSPLPDEEIDKLVTDNLNHYAILFNIKAAAAKADVCYLISGVWKTSTERLFLWIGGFRPSELLKVLVPQLDLLDQQSHDLYNLIQACQQAEDSLSQGMEKLQQTLTEAVACSQALGGGCYEMHNAMNKLEELVRLVIQADFVRHETLQQTLRNLTTRQAAQGLISLGEYFQRLRNLSAAWATRPCEPA